MLCQYTPRPLKPKDVSACKKCSATPASLGPGDDYHYHLFSVISCSHVRSTASAASSPSTSPIDPSCCQRLSEATCYHLPLPGSDFEDDPHATRPACRAYPYHDGRDRGDPVRYRTLSSGEKVIVALALSRLDWLRAEGVDNLVQARDRIGLEWSRAVSSATWKYKASDDKASIAVAASITRD